MNNPAVSHVTSKLPSILLYNPISGHGHLDSWNAMFVSILLDAGWQVNALTPDAQDLLRRLKSKNQAFLERLHILDWNVLRSSFTQRVLGRLQRLIGIQTNHQDDTKDLDPRFLDPLEFARRINASIKKCKWQPSLVFNMYMDMYPIEGTRWKQFESLNKLSWAGIRFVPTSEQAEIYYKQSALKGICFLDESVCEQAQQTMPQKVFGYLPDITENALPLTESALVREIKEKARGRKIVFMGGTIGGNKNLASWYQLINQADPREFYFVQVGEMFEDTLTTEDALELAKIKNECPENLYIKLEYLPDEAMFNEVIRASDIIFAVYRNFKISSNMPGKAAAFNKPILVAEGYLMGGRVSKYGIGLTVAENDVGAMKSAISTLAHTSESMTSQFDAYRRDFSIQALSERYTDFLKKCMLSV
jgi:glycosyltransferase involved in cell wall biosynthesis